MSKKDKHSDVNRLLRDLFKDDARVKAFQLKELFEQRLDDLSITKHQACIILDVENKTLDSVLEGDSKKIDFLTILKLSYLLNISHHDLIDKYFDLVFDTKKESIEKARKRSFLVDNFDLPELKRIGLIDSINDFDAIESKIKSFFSYENIFEYGKNKISATLSSGKRKSGKKSLNFWFEAVCKSIEKTPNPNTYDREALINYFPKIRMHSMNVEEGLLVVAQKLFKFGVTLIIVPKFNKNLHLRGATFSHREKPCIALTKYTQFYPTLWFALIHELYHVLYDWDTIKNEKHHFSIEIDDSGKRNVAKIIDDFEIDEDEANDFAREYLFSKEKLEEVLPHIDEPMFIDRYARENHVHPSFVYNFYLWEYGKSSLYGKYNKFFPKDEYDNLLENFKVGDYLTFKPVKDISRDRNINLKYNTI
ncbi:ImmA/IrrE family metallo-endopeptidase [Flagellimonas olearia]|uniref:ImmA/IrrE family metallo-endopeptidase n=1 Tax=Flagellimonas olearia TaxID=552546 RepID=A0A444VLV3_9FLAO|nr:hypothetical protein [Allomuricauda olearia]RYC51758.1 hypothetical protein DN53_13100 [Allomuricauda olearia]